MNSPEYLKPTEIAEKLKTCVKTVYNYLHKYKNEIKTLKHWQSRLICLEDLKNIFERENTPKAENPDFLRYEFKIQFLQNTLNSYNQLISTYKSDNEDLKKEYEKKIDWLELQKAELLNANIKTLKKYYLALVLAVGLIVAIFFLNFNISV